MSEAYTEDVHAVLTKRLAVAGGDDKVVHEGWPVVWPLVLEDLNEDGVELVDEGALALEGMLVGAEADDEVADIVFHAIALGGREGIPLELDDVFKDLAECEAEGHMKEQPLAQIGWVGWERTERAKNLELEEDDFSRMASARVQPRSCSFRRVSTCSTRDLCVQSCVSLSCPCYSDVSSAQLAAHVPLRLHRRCRTFQPQNLRALHPAAG